MFFFNAANRSVNSSTALDSSSRYLNRDLCLIGLATAHFNLQQRAEARSFLQQISDPEHPKIGGRYYGEIGWNALRDEAYDEAADAFRNSLRFDRVNKYSFNGLGNALYELGRYEEAKNALKFRAKT